ncbi:unnamed protein product [Chondrus crispus]|uniref:Uncharacterized protein n=1 Tax=Chondrus crispus TaxID=2769 RepID=R7QQV8_CHOCR|nr:unnamed protein product [Chondrus crispus]CDF40138.1 unnamed protein product [Chondrus crispus]|eukprot:XP_005710432.1 unnamed protein product [Chondrus crispus]
MANECHDVLVGVRRRSQCAWGGQRRWDGRRWRRFAPGWSRKCCCCVRAGRGRTRSGMAGPSTFWRDGRGKSMHAVVGILDRRETLVISRQIPHRCAFWWEAVSVDQ